MRRRTALWLIVWSLWGLSIAALFWALVLLVPAIFEPRFGDPIPNALGISLAIVLIVIAIGLALTGSFWMIRILRGVDHLDDESDHWRFRDH